MPPDQFPWERRDFRKHERSGSDPRFGGGCGGGWTNRWRDQHPHPHPHAPPYTHQPPPQPWYSDFRTSRSIPPGHGKQGGWHMYPDEAGHVFMPFGSRYNDRDLADDCFRPFGSRADAKYLRNSRENRESFSQKDWKSHSWEPPVSSSGPGRPITEVNNQRAVQNSQTCHKENNQKLIENIQTYHKVNTQKAVEENVQTCHKVNTQKAVENTQTCHKVNGQKAVENTQTCHKVNYQKAVENTQICYKVNSQKVVENTWTCHKSDSVNNDSAHPLSASSSCPSQSLLKENHEKNRVAAADTLASSVLNTEKESDLGSIDWKPLKWSRSGSLVSRGSGFSHSSSSKSLGVDSAEIMVDVQQKDVTPIQSPTAAAAAVGMPSAPDSSDETSSRKKPRLGWGEGLAKYEKKKVDGHEDDVAKDRLIVSVTSAETMHLPSVNLVDKSPRFANLSNCASPATPVSVACSSSPGMTIEEKESTKAADLDHNIGNLSCSPGVMSQICHEGPAFNLENLELSSIANLSLLIDELLHSNDPCYSESNYIWNKLLVCKVNVLKAIEVTESAIESLETERKCLTADSYGFHPCPAAYSSQSGECPLTPREEHGVASDYTDPLPIASSGNMVDEVTPVALEEERMEVKDEEIDSPGTATSKLVEAQLSAENGCTSKAAECVDGFVKLDFDSSSDLNQTCLENDLRDEDNACPGDYSTPIVSNCRSGGNVQYDHIYDSILASNKESANRALEELKKLLPDRKCVFDISTASRISRIPRDSFIIKENLQARKRSLKFKEKVITLKFKVFQHFWKEGRVVSVTKLWGKSPKVFDPSRTGFKRNRSSFRSRISYFAGSNQIATAEEVIEFVNGLLSVSPFKSCRKFLKMPGFILDKEIRTSRFISNNGLVEDPCVAEKERSIINPWTAQEREIFIDKLATFGKNFRKIASFLDHKTIADCIEFYYKNHKSECFERARKKPDFAKQSKPQATTYLVATGKRSNREVNAVNLDILGDASIIAAAVNDGLGTQQPKLRSRILLGASGSHDMPRGNDDPLQRSNSLDMYSNETAAADVLAGICCSLSSEAMSSCITNSFEPADRYQDRKCPRASSSIKQPLTHDVTQNVDDECSDESCAKIDTTDWNDDEKSIFIQAMSTYGKDFARISQCVRTKTNEQCKIFFSKARKCLGLDQIHTGTGNADSGDANGGGSDVEDGCAVQNGSVICSDDSENKIEENLALHEMKMDHTSDTAESRKWKPDVNDCGEVSRMCALDNDRGEVGRMCALDSMAASPVLKNSSVNVSQVADKPVVDFNGGNRKQSGANGSELEVGTMCISSNSSSLQVELGVDCVLPVGSSEADNKASAEISDGHVNRGNWWCRQNLDGKKVESLDASLVDVNFSSAVRELKLEHQHTGSVSRPSVDVHSSMQVESGPQKEVGLDSGSAGESIVISSQQNGHIASVESSKLFSVPIKYQTQSVGNAFPNVGSNGMDKKYLQTFARAGDCQLRHSGNSLTESIESSQILRGYPVPVQSMKDINVGVNCKKIVLPQNIPSGDGVHLDQHADFSLKNCTRHQSEVVKSPCSSQEQSCGDKSRPPLLDIDKPSRNGDVKLFGKILVSSKQEPDSCIQDSGPNDTQHDKTSGELLNLKLGGDEKVESKFDCNNYLGTGNIPVGSFGLWDANKTHMGFPLLDSTLLLTKYPAAFANHSITAANLEQPPLSRVSKSNDHPLNGVSVIPREMSRNVGLPEFPPLRNREMQPLTQDVRQTQDVILSEMQRMNGFDVMTMGMQQQQARMMAGINNVVGRGVVLHGDQIPAGTSNPVAAVKRHYGIPPNFSMQANGGSKGEGGVGR